MRLDLRRVSDRRVRRIIITIVAILLCSWVFLYRFNTLGGSFGGFDNDHFLHFVHAKQIEAGEQPLRDFLDSGLQGARPSLTYELSAAAQRYWGDNLRSEAWLTVGGVALGATLAFLAGSTIAAWPWALATALLSAFVSPKLYGYPKVLITAVAAVIIVGCRGLPSWPRIAAMSVCTAIAFLFRHDYAIYCGLGFGLVVLLSAGARWQDRLTRAAVYGVITIVLLAPSLGWIQYYRGIPEYVRNGLEISRAEALRTGIDWPRLDLTTLVSASEDEENAKAWIYYVFLSLPVLVLGATAWRRARGASSEDPPVAVLVALSLMTMVLSHYFLRGNLAARFGDMAPPIAVLGAYLLSIATGHGGRLPLRRVPLAVAAVGVLSLTAMCIWQTGSVSSELRTARLLSPGDVAEQTRRTSQDLVQMPRSLRDSQAADAMQAASYLHRCTRPTDRVLVVGYATDVLAFSERLFAGRRADFVVGYYADERYSREAIDAIEGQSVPIVLGGPALFDTRIPLLTDYLRSHYDEVGVVLINQGSLRVLARRGVASQPAGPNGLPCFA